MSDPCLGVNIMNSSVHSISTLSPNYMQSSSSGLTEDTPTDRTVVDKRLSDKVADCSLTSQATSDCSFISAVSRIKSEPDIDTTADFESAGEEDLFGDESTNIANSDLWFQSLEYNGDTTISLDHGNDPHEETLKFTVGEDDIVFRPESSFKSSSPIKSPPIRPIKDRASKSPVKSVRNIQEVELDSSKSVNRNQQGVSKNSTVECLASSESSDPPIENSVIPLDNLAPIANADICPELIQPVVESANVCTDLDNSISDNCCLSGAFEKISLSDCGPSVESISKETSVYLSVHPVDHNVEESSLQQLICRPENDINISVPGTVEINTVDSVPRTVEINTVDSVEKNSCDPASKSPVKSVQKVEQVELVCVESTDVLVIPPDNCIKENLFTTERNKVSDLTGLKSSLSENDDENCDLIVDSGEKSNLGITGEECVDEAADVSINIVSENPVADFSFHCSSTNVPLVNGIDSSSSFGNSAVTSIVGEQSIGSDVVKLLDLTIEEPLLNYKSKEENLIDQTVQLNLSNHLVNEINYEDRHPFDKSHSNETHLILGDQCDEAINSAIQFRYENIKKTNFVNEPCESLQLLDFSVDGEARTEELSPLTQTNIPRQNNSSLVNSIETVSTESSLKTETIIPDENNSSLVNPVETISTEFCSNKTEQLIAGERNSSLDNPINTVSPEDSSLETETVVPFEQILLPINSVEATPTKNSSHNTANFIPNEHNALTVNSIEAIPSEQKLSLVNSIEAISTEYSSLKTETVFPHQQNSLPIDSAEAISSENSSHDPVTVIPSEHSSLKVDLVEAISSEQKLSLVNSIEVVSSVYSCHNTATIIPVEQISLPGISFEEISSEEKSSLVNSIEEICTEAEKLVSLVNGPVIDVCEFSNVNIPSIDIKESDKVICEKDLSLNDKKLNISGSANDCDADVGGQPSQHHTSHCSEPHHVLSLTVDKNSSTVQVENLNRESALKLDSVSSFPLISADRKEIQTDTDVKTTASFYPVISADKNVERNLIVFEKGIGDRKEDMSSGLLTNCTDLELINNICDLDIMSQKNQSLLTDEIQNPSKPPVNKSLGMDSLINHMGGLCMDSSETQDFLDHDRVSDVSSTGSLDDLNDMTEEELSGLLDQCRSKIDIKSSTLINSHIPDLSMIASISSEMKPVDLNTTEAGPITASDDIQAGELSQVIGEVDISELKRKADTAPHILDNSLFKQFDPIQDLSNSKLRTDDSFFKNLESNDKVKLEESLPSTKHYSGLLVPVTPFQAESTPTGRHDQTRLQGSSTTPRRPTDRSAKPVGVSPSTSFTTGAGGDMLPSPKHAEVKAQLHYITERQARHEAEVAKMNAKIAEAKARLDSALSREADLKASRQPHSEKLANALALLKRNKEDCEAANEKYISYVNKVGQHEETMHKIVSQGEEMRKQFQEKIKKTSSERDTVLKHAENIDTAFNDIQQKYENIVKCVHDSRIGIIKQSVILKEKEKEIDVSSENYAKLLKHSTDRLHHANKERSNLIRNHSVEMERAECSNQQLELKIKSNEQKIKHQENEIAQTTKIYNDLLRKLN